MCINIIYWAPTKLERSSQLSLFFFFRGPETNDGTPPRERMGVRNQPTFGNRLKQHHIYRVISAQRSRPFPPFWLGFGTADVKAHLIYVGLFGNAFIRNREEERKLRGERFHNSLYTSGSLPRIPIFNQFTSKRNDPGINELLASSSSAAEVK